MNFLQTYFRYQDGVSVASGDDVIIAHIEKNYAGWLYEIRQRATQAVEDQPGSTLQDHQLHIVSEAVWYATCMYWDDDAFKTKSEQMKKNRGQLWIIHMTGSESFEEVKSICIYIYLQSNIVGIYSKVM